MRKWNVGSLLKIEVFALATVGSLILWPQDRAFLAAGVLLKNNDLLDLMTNRCVTLNEVAALLIASLGREKSIGEAVDSVSAANGWDSQEVTGDLIDLLDELDKSALLVVKKNWKARLAPSVLWLQLISWLTLEWSRPATRRYRPTVFSLAWVCIRSGSLGIVLSAMASIGLFAALVKNDPANEAGKHIYGVVPLSLYVFCLFHVFAHESGHLAAANISKQTCNKYVFSRGLRLGVAHDVLALTERRAIALCGPVAGVLGAQIVALGFLAIPFLSSYAFLISLSGVAHLYSLFPWTADGKQIWQRKGHSES